MKNKNVTEMVVRCVFKAVVIIVCTKYKKEIEELFELEKQFRNRLDI